MFTQQILLNPDGLKNLKDANVQKGLCGGEVMEGDWRGRDYSMQNVRHTCMKLSKNKSNKNAAKEKLNHNKMKVVQVNTGAQARSASENWRIFFHV